MNVPEWFIKLVEHLTDAAQQYRWQEYLSYRDEGYSTHYALVAMGLRDPSY